MKVGDYVRTKKRGFQYPQIAQIKSMSKDSGYKNQYFIELDHNLLPDMEYKIYKEDIDKSSTDIKELLMVGDYVNGYKVINCDEYEIYVDTQDFNEVLYESDIKSVVTKEAFESIEYKIGE